MATAIPSAVTNIPVADDGAAVTRAAVVRAFTEALSMVPVKADPTNFRSFDPAPPPQNSIFTVAEAVSAVPMVLVPSIGTSEPAERVRSKSSRNHAPFSIEML